MGELTENVKWVPVIVGAVLSFGLGWLCFLLKLFGAKWTEGVGVTIDKA